MTMAFYSKSFGISALKGAEITDEMLTKINRYAIKPLKAEDVYVRKYLMAHTGIDRDRERFPEEIISDFEKTLPGKSLLIGHSRPGPGIGLYFDAYTEDMTAEKFLELTKEKIKLPEGITTVKTLWGIIYMVKAAFNDETIANIEAGIYRHASIGFRASDLLPVKGEFDQVLYWEYVAPGEALEGSIVWLGAQPGATAQKAGGKDEKEHLQAQKFKGREKMEELLKKLSKAFGKLFTEETVIDEIKAMVEDGRHTIAKALKAEEAKASELDAKVKELQPLAEEGKAYRKGLVDAFVANKAKLGDVGETPEAQKALREVVETYPIGFLKTESEVLEKRVAEKFPDSQLKGGRLGERTEEKKENPLTPKD